MQPAYLDHNATTPIDPRVAEVITRVSLDFPANPESPHAMGRAARARMEESRELVAELFGAEPGEIIFTSGGTESDNLAILGVARARKEAGGHLITTRVEHPAVIRSMDVLEGEGYAVSRLPVSAEGVPSVEAFRGSVRKDSILASVMVANNETGAIFPVAEMAAVAREHGVLLHTDAVQAVGKIPVRVDDLGVDLLSSASHKFSGPRGVGILYVRQGTPVLPLLVGGHQERGLRPGTSTVALAAGFARALELAIEEMDARIIHVRALADRLLDGIESTIDDVALNGPRDGRLPNTVNLTIRGVGGEALLIALDREAFCIATGSACASGSALPSHVLTAMGLEKRAVSSSIRLSVGPSTRMEDIDRFLEVLPGIVERLRRLSGAVS